MSAVYQAVAGQMNQLAARRQQQQQFDAELKLRQQQLDQEHEYQQAQVEHLKAALGLQQAYQQANLRNEIAANPQIARAIGQQTGQTTFGAPQFAPRSGQPSDINQAVGPVTGPSTVPTVSQDYTVDTGLGKPFSLSVPTPEEVGRQFFAEKEPTLDFAQREERRKQAEELAYKYHDLNETLAQKNLHDIAEFANQIKLEGMRGDVQRDVANIMSRRNMQLQVDPQALGQTLDDLQHGRLTLEQLNRDKGITEEEKILLRNSAAKNGVSFLTDKDVEKLKAAKSLLPYFQDAQDLIAAAPYSEGPKGAAIRGTYSELPFLGNDKVRQLQQQLNARFSEYAGAYKTTVSRLTQQEANRAIQGAVPSIGGRDALSTQGNIDKLEAFRQTFVNGLEGELAHIKDPLQRRQIVEEYLGGSDIYKPIYNQTQLQHQAAGRGPTAPSGTTHYVSPSNPTGWNIPKDKEAAFLKAHPDAKVQ